jgi:hypothetical protein
VRRGYAAAAIGLCVLLAACARGETTYEGSSSSPTGTGPSATATGTATAAPSASGDPEALARAESLTELAIKAQEAAAKINALQSNTAIPPRSGPVLGADISWPQCPAGMGIERKISSGAPLPTAEAEYVVIGLTNGPGFHANPCLADQVAWARDNGLLVAAYSVISWPDDAAQEQHGGLHGAGYAQAQFNVQSMAAAGLESPIIWLDVEQVPHYEWSTDPVANAEVVVGAAQGYVDAGYRVGVYSTPYIWESIVGDLSLGAPEWRAAGQTSRAEAESRCGKDWVIQGGMAVLGQWVQDDRDKNVTCPGVEADLGLYFAATAGGG